MRLVRRAAALCLGGLLCVCLAVAQGGAPLPPLNLQPDTGPNLLSNASFEDADAGGWRFSDWPPRPDTSDRLIADSIRYTDEQAQDGRQCLVYDLTTVGEERILIAQQALTGEQLAPWDGQRMRLGAWILLASGPTAQDVMMTMRQWGESGPPLDAHSLRMTADVNEWSRWSTEFVFRMGETRRGDVNISVRQSPDLTNSPVVYLDNVSLEVLLPPPLDARVLSGETLLTPDDSLPVEVAVSEEAWDDGLRALRWDITTPDGLTGLAGDDVTLDARDGVVVVPVPSLSEGRYALRLALGRAPGERTHEVLLPFRRAEGPFAR